MTTWNCGIMITCTGTIRVERMSRKSRSRPGEAQLGERVACGQVQRRRSARTDTAATTTELPSQRANGYCRHGST